MATMLEAESVGARARALVHRRAALTSLSWAQRAGAIGGAMETLADANSGLGGSLRRALAKQTGLSDQVIEWGLQASLGAADTSRLQALGKPEGKPLEILTVVLSGNLFGAAVRALVLPLLCGVPVLAKASSRDGATAQFIKLALGAQSTAMGGALEVVTFGRGHATATQNLLHASTTLAVYGSDGTIATLIERLPHGSRVIEHGHGLGAALLTGQVLSDEAALTEKLRALALDVAAYDQQGCLSPHLVLVSEGGTVSPLQVAQRLHASLEEVELRLPRGPLDETANATQMQWRGVATARGQLFTAEQHSVSYEGSQSLRPAPGFRNVGVYSVKDEAAGASRLNALGPHLKALSLGEASELERFGTQLSEGVTPYLCEVGQMQQPPLSAWLDGRPPFYGFTRR